MDLNEQRIEEMKNKYGKDTLKNFADMMLDIMVQNGDKCAKVLKARQEYNDIIQKFIEEKLIKLNEKQLDETFEYFNYVNEQTKEFIKRIEEDK